MVMGTNSRLHQVFSISFELIAGIPDNSLQDDYQIRNLQMTGNRLTLCFSLIHSLILHTWTM